MSEDQGSFSRVVAAQLLREAREKGISDEELELAASTGHKITSTRKKHKWTDALPSKQGSVISSEIEKIVDATQGKVGDAVNPNSSEGSPIVQYIASRIQQLARNRKIRNLPENRRAQVLKEIEDEIIEKNGW